MITKHTTQYTLVWKYFYIPLVYWASYFVQNGNKRLEILVTSSFNRARILREFLNFYIPAATAAIIRIIIDEVDVENACTARYSNRIDTRGRRGAKIGRKLTHKAKKDSRGQDPDGNFQKIFLA
ncbi:hypothetical protein L1049_003058 [Liquidambar formosana]|uniref:Uncharacterized protein n=1 Tax=Liquidambar formosana TaxID=63359 RepID=A0AAP0NIF0_LIQFO